MEQQNNSQTTSADLNQGMVLNKPFWQQYEKFGQPLLQIEHLTVINIQTKEHPIYQCTAIIFQTEWLKSQTDLDNLLTTFSKSVKHPNVIQIKACHNFTESDNQYSVYVTDLVDCNLEKILINQQNSSIQQTNPQCQLLFQKNQILFWIKELLNAIQHQKEQNGIEIDQIELNSLRFTYINDLTQYNEKFLNITQEELKILFPEGKLYSTKLFGLTLKHKKILYNQIYNSAYPIQEYYLPPICQKNSSNQCQIMYSLGMTIVQLMLPLTAQELHDLQQNEKNIDNYSVQISDKELQYLIQRMIDYQPNNRFKCIQQITEEVDKMLQNCLQQNKDSNSQGQKKLNPSQFINNIQQSQDDVVKRAYGCVIGAFLGDSLGSYCEFKNSISQKVLLEAMRMQGGGTFGLIPAQVTDDSEIAIAMAYGLVEGQGKLDLDKICTHYGEWYDSNPFDCGNTIGKAFRCAGKYIGISNQDKNYKSPAIETRNFVQYYNIRSLSNGCLMRITPMVIYCLQFSEDQDIIDAVSCETSLTHSNEVAIQACVSYVLALVQLIRSGNPTQAFDKAKDYIYCKQKENLSQLELQQWWENIVEKDQIMPGVPNMGFLKIAWTYSFTFLKRIKEQKINIDQENCYKEIISQVIQQAGDTDTNACIVGGMVGAILGVQRLPKDYLEKFCQCDVTKSQNNRPKKYNPWKILKKIQTILEFRKSQTKLVILPEQYSPNSQK